MNIKDLSIEQVKKLRFDFLKKNTRGHGKLLSPLNGKNKAQRNRIISGMQCMNG